MKAIAVWDIDEIREAYEDVPEMIPEMERRWDTLFRFMHDNKMLTKKIVDSSGKVTARRLFSKDFTAEGRDFAGSYESSYLKSKASSDPEKGRKLLERYLRELREKRKRRR
jgi:hypothetical protein